MKKTKTKKKINLDHLSQLAKLKLTPQEKKRFQKQLVEILNYVAQLNEIKTEKVVPTSQTTGLENVFRNDEPTPSLTTEEVLGNAPAKHNDFFKVKAVLEK